MEIKVDIERTDTQVIVHLSGKLDTAASFHVEEQTAAIDTTSLDVVVDCKDLEYISSSGIRLLVAMQKKKVAENKRVILRHLNSMVSNVLHLTGLDKVFTIED